MTNPNKSEIIHHAGGGTTLIGLDAINLLKAITLKAHLKLYAKTGIKPTRGVSGPDMLRLAEQYTGKKYKRGQYDLAAADVDVWVQTMKAALPVTDNRKDDPA